MRIQILSIGNKMSDWVVSGFNEYTKRLTGALPVELIEIPALKRHKSSDITGILAQEGKLILDHIRTHDYCVVLDVRGQAWSTEQLATELAQWQQNGDNVALVIGGPEGLAPSVYQRANARWSLSKLTFPHPLIRIMLAEQLYRAWTILNHHPYHRA